jgi:hypothetical protein
LRFGQVRFELVEAVAPHLAVRLKPFVELYERLRTDAVETSLAVRAYPDQACVAKDAQVFRDGRLTDGQALDEGVNRLLALAELVKNVPTAGLGDHLNRCAHTHIAKYAPDGIYLSRHILRVSGDTGALFG